MPPSPATRRGFVLRCGRNTIQNEVNGRKPMELPIFNDNLRSSAAWSVALEREREQWQQAQASTEARTELETRLRALQVQEAMQRASLSARAPQAGEQAAENFLRAARLVSAWAAEPEAVL